MSDLNRRCNESYVVNYDISLGAELGNTVDSWLCWPSFIINGYTCPVSISIPDHSAANKSDYASRECLAPPYLGLRADGRYLCPKQKLIANPGKSQSLTINHSTILGCLSNCRVKNDSLSCCRYGYNKPSCPPSSPWVHEACPEAFNRETTNLKVRDILPSLHGLLFAIMISYIG